MKTLHVNYIELFDLTVTGYLTLTLEGRIDTINSAGTKLLGLKKKNLINEPFSTFVADEHKDIWVHYLNLPSEKQYCDLPLNRKDGTIIYVRIAFLFKHVKDAALKLHITITDITDLKEAEKTWLDRCQHLEREVKASQVELEKKKTEIAELDAVLNFVAKQQEEEKTEIKLALSKGAEHTLLPVINKLKKYNENKLLHKLLETLENNLLSLFHNHGCMTDYSFLSNKLTRSEAMVAAMVIQGLTSKAIAKSLAISPETVSIHRKNIRKKLGLENKGDNLYSHLKSLAE